MAAGTRLKLGWSDPRTDVFGAHPLLGDIMDLNDGVTFTLVDDTLEIEAPTREIALAGNPRVQGERATRALYRHNRQARAQFILGPMASYSDLIANVRALVRWVDAAPAVPITLQWQPPSATAPVYLDVVGAAHAFPADERDWLRFQVEPVELVFVVRPGLRGDRVTLSNLVANPGFEAGSGGAGGGSSVTVFNDPLANFNAYTATGGALTQDSVTYGDVVLADGPVRYYRLDEASGTTLSDVSASGQNATATASGVTYGVAGALAGSSDTALTLNGTSGYLSIPTTGLPTGAGPWSIETWVYFTANPASSQAILSLGTAANDKLAQLTLTTTGGVLASLYFDDTATSSPLTLSAWHHLVATYDGATLALYLDGGAPLTHATVAGNLTYGTATIGANYNGTAYVNFFAGRVDEVAIYPTALSAARVAAHYTAGHTAPSASMANTLQVPAGASAAFGSAAWGSINQWQVRFRYRAGMTASLNAHAPDASDNLGAKISGGGSSGVLTLQQTIAGVAHTLASASFPATQEAWYWLQFTQFPSVPGMPPDVLASVLRDASGSPGAALATVGLVPTYDAVTALAGVAQLSVSGAALGIGGAFANVQRMTLFGPGAWLFSSSGAGMASGAWEQNTSNTYTGGAVASFGAARVDLPPTGAVNATWENYSGGAPAGTSAIAASSGQVLQAAVYARSSGLSSTAALSLAVREWDASGAHLRATTLQSVTGNQATWIKLAGSLTLGASTAYISLQLGVADATPGASAGGVVWFDNAQCWNQTTTGAASMPYCKLRSAQSPAQLLVTGLLGDLPAPAYVAWGTYLTSWAPNATLTYGLGRRAQASANAKLVGASIGAFGAGFSPQSAAVVDSGSYGGYYVQALANPSWNPRAFSTVPADLLGVYHLIHRFYTTQTAGNLSNLETRIVTQQKTQPWYGAIGDSDQVGAYNGPFTSPLTASTTWTVVDSGQVNVPALPVGALTDLTQNYLTPRPQWGDLTPGGSMCRCNWQCLLPVDGSLLVGLLNNPSNAGVTISNQWLWVYLDGLLVNRAAVGDGASATYSVESLPLPNPARGAGGPGTSTTGVINVNSAADPYLILDPTVSVAAPASAAGGSGVNQLAGYVADQAGAVLPLHVELQYSPLYLYPR